MTVKTLNDLFLHELSCLHDAEKQLAKAQSRMARAAADTELSAEFQAYQQQTVARVERIEEIAAICGLHLKRVKCAAMEGLMEEVEDLIHDGDKAAVRDAALIGTAQKIEHHEIATYGTLATFARHLRLKEAGALLQEALDEKKGSDRKLTAFAERKSNFEAEAAA
ncbi:MAG: DUF892 family protein [Comamonadaceae bacterium]|nr:MAG: DUF892 family protein [Comamonadaceae bacterium]